MAALTPLTSTTMEGALLELIEELSDKQANVTANPNAVQLISSYSRDGSTGQISISLTVDSTSAEGVDGKPIISATEVFS